LPNLATDISFNLPSSSSSSDDQNENQFINPSTYLNSKKHQLNLPAIGEMVDDEMVNEMVDHEMDDEMVDGR